MTVKFKKPKEIAEMKRTHFRMATVLNELDILEDGLDCDYSEVATDYRWIVQQLEHRRETLLKRGRRL